MASWLRLAFRLRLGLAFHRSGAGLFVARQDVIRAFPRREKIEIAEFLREPDRIVDDAFLLIVVADFNKPGEREVLAQRMPLESVIGQDAAHVRMTGEQYAVEI